LIDRHLAQPTTSRTFAPRRCHDGAAIKDLDLGEDMWISLVNRAGELVPVTGATVLLAEDEVLLMVDSHTAHRYDLFTSPQQHRQQDGGRPDS
jgi:NhaP-type Na+/H+ and K+/H+ antiporter